MVDLQSVSYETIVEAYRYFTQLPEVTSASIRAEENENIISVQSMWSQRDIDRKEKTSFGRTYVLDAAKNVVVSCSSPQEINNQVWNVASPSGKYRAILRKQKDKKGDDKQYLEIWNAVQKVKTINVEGLEKHGKIISDDGHFGSFQWSRAEGHVLYVAEKKRPKASSFFDSKPFSESTESKEKETARGDEFLYYQNWGEQITEQSSTVLCVMDVETGTVSVLESVPENVSPGQAVWAPDDAGVVFIGWIHEPYRLGLKHCVQRRSFVYHLDIQKNKIEKISEDGRAVRFPRFSPDDRWLVYLDTLDSGPHNMCSRLMMCEWERRHDGLKPILDIVNSAKEEEFPGLFTWSVPVHTWLSDSIHLVLNTFWGSRSEVVVVNTQTKSVVRVRPDLASWSSTVLDIHGNHVVIGCSSPNQAPYLIFGTLVPSDLGSSQWLRLDNKSEVITSFEWQIIQHSPSSDRVHPKYGNLDYESILYLPKGSSVNGSKPPLILFPHGGPHSVCDGSFAFQPAVYCHCGFAVLLVNFRGSLGFGQDSILSILGRIGDQDVKDCKSAADEVIEKGLADGTKVVVCGGSHGGFLATHLIGQYPDYFKAACARNPVTNLTSMVGTTDIISWVFTEVGETFSYDTQVDATILSKMWDASPVRCIKQVKTPVLLQVGLKDLRVPPSQSLEYWKMLKANGVPVRCLTYPDSNHPLSEVEVEADGLINSILWFCQHLTSQ
ncbi:acylamino-acid-releasing enzyme-like isoform X1 [Pomacea canaliculata]|uniref:acylamino-acid-releasing enzyme-like isoform X1 n=1 Tax=Pomacea canaliculata TaxID=400727 RepID=UPI000D72A44E|nr:acylamino-acid-releasing enzyme-like isoform X1 [Pomacea canaliculata]